MRDNGVKQRLSRGEWSFGTMAWEFFSPNLPQVCAAAGAEFLLLDMEHSGVSLETIKMQLAACRGLPIVPFVRVPTTAYQYVSRVLDAGALGVMVPMVESAAQARDIVTWSRYPPKGRRGAAFSAAHDDFVAGDVVAKMAAAHERTFLMCQIETETGLAHVEEISAVDGVDCLWVGQFDLTNFLGIPARFDSPLYLNALDRVVAAADRHGKVAGFLATDEPSAALAVAKGFRVIAYGVDTALLQSALRAGLAELQRGTAAAAGKTSAGSTGRGRSRRQKP